jgi:hypothetical protein
VKRKQVGASVHSARLKKPSLWHFSIDSRDNSLTPALENRFSYEVFTQSRPDGAQPWRRQFGPRTGRFPHFRIPQADLYRTFAIIGDLSVEHPIPTALPWPSYRREIDASLNFRMSPNSAWKKAAMPDSAARLHEAGWR